MTTQPAGRETIKGSRIRSPGRLAAKQWRYGIGEFYRSFSKRAFVRALQRLVPEVCEADLTPGVSGVRAQASGRIWFNVPPARVWIYRKA